MTPQPLLRRTTDINLAEAYQQMAAAKVAVRLHDTLRGIAHATATQPLTFVQWLDGRTS